MPTFSRQAGIVFVLLLVFTIPTIGQDSRRIRAARHFQRTDADFFEGPRRVQASHLF